MIHALSKILFVASFATVIYNFTKDMLCIWEVIYQTYFVLKQFSSSGYSIFGVLLAIKFLGITFIVANMEIFKKLYFP